MHDLLASVTAAEAPCPFCGAGALRARLDRRSRLYLSCGLCRGRVFAPLTVDRAADLLAGAAVLASPQGRLAVAHVRGQMGLLAGGAPLQQLGGAASAAATGTEDR